MSRLRLENTLLGGRYEVHRWLAQGSYAEIFIAREREKTSPSIIIKALNVRLQGHADADLERTLLENFHGEALILDAVRHPNIIRRFGHGTAQDLDGVLFHYLTLEYLAGGNLAEFCQRNGKLSLEQTLFYFQQVAEGLANAHAKNVIHRDLKPSNLLLSEDLRTIKIADFGVAKVARPQAEDLTRVGTDVYAPPEHHPNLGLLATGSRKLTAAADTYALAKTIYTVMSGQSPHAFRGQAILTLPPGLQSVGYGDELLRILRKATASEVEARYAEVEHFWSDFSRLAEWQEDEATRVRPRSARSAPIEPIPELAPEPSFQKNEAKAAAQAPYFSPSAPSLDGRQRGRIIVQVERVEPLPNSASAFAAAERASALAYQPNDSPSAEPAYPPVVKSSRFNIPPALIGFLVTAVCVTLFIGSMTALYRNLRRRFAGGSRPPASAPTQPGGFAAVSNTGVNVRLEPGTGENIVGTLGSGVRVEVLEVRGQWYRIRPERWDTRKSDDVNDGWSYGRFFSRDE